MIKKRRRCDWATADLQMLRYHDEEWGTPVHDDRKLFEFLLLEGFQAGLSWSTILHKRQNFREAFARFDPKKVAWFSAKDKARLMRNAGIIRNKLKIDAAISNAKAFLAVQKEFGSFDKYIWEFVNHKPVKTKLRDIKRLPACTPLSDTVSADLKKRGFKFVGSTVVYAHMQATGMVNDHLVYCWRH
ncbi:DNA-3-methyladenine glycosylase I [Candidatus Kaiserbacteria bacterium]|nr:DNA-3-methyladenine glycosylase I [Candidatus Kaiserbacteria bacterium]